MKQAPNGLGRLLHELSWEGNAAKYRHGGPGLENVLTVEVFEALNFLPRAEFLGRILGSVEGGNPSVLNLLAEQVEELKLSLLPGDIHLAPILPNGKCALRSQPDGIIESSQAFCLLEAKRIRKPASSFPIEQLAKEFLAVIHKAKSRSGLLLLVLPEAPPVRVAGHGRLSLNEAVNRFLPQVLKKAEVDLPPLDELRSKIDSTLAHVTWQRVYEEVEGALRSFSSSDPSIRGTVSRLANAALDAIRWHGNTRVGADPESAKVLWDECDVLDNLGHGVQFLHSDLQNERSRGAVAFLEGFGWLQRFGGTPASVRLLTKCPPSIARDRWSEITRSTREAVLSFLSDKGNLNASFRHEKIGVLING